MDTMRHGALLWLVALVTASVAFPLASQPVIGIDPETVELGPIRHKQLPPALVERVRALEPVFADVYPITHEQWLEGFQRDANPEREIAIWESMAEAFARFTAKRDFSIETRSEALGLLLLRSQVTADVALEQAQFRYLTPAQARELVSLYKAPPQPITAVPKRKRRSAAPAQ